MQDGHDAFAGDRSLGDALDGPVLIVAEPTAIGKDAPRWAAAFADRGLTHRVLLFGGGASRCVIDAIVDEARSLGARTIMAAGGGETVEAARSAAAILGLPFVPVAVS